MLRSTLATAAGLALLSAATEASAAPSSRHSPMTADVVAHLRGVVERGHHRTDVFSKVGDSITASTNFLTCFASPRDVDLGGREDLATTLSFFSRASIDDSHLSWNRLSRSAFVGWSTFGALGTRFRSPVHEELRATDAAFAVVMYGTNETYGGGVINFDRNLRRLVREILDDGVVPLLSTIPPRRDSPPLDGVVREMNVVVRQIGESEKLPVMDFAAVLAELPGWGLGPDGIHPRALEHHPCWLNDEGLKNGMNARNLLVLEALDRARRFVVDGETPEG